MAENPLLPHAELRALYSWTQRAQAVYPKAQRKKDRAEAAQREALFAATVMQLRAVDTLVPGPDDTAALKLLKPEKGKAPQTVSTLHVSGSETQMLAAVGLASACVRSGADGVVLTLVRAGVALANWRDALTWAQAEELPLILAIADPSSPDAFQTSVSSRAEELTWASLQRLARELHLPVLSVDGEDAVAVYRVMQESVLRARSGAGPAILWAMLPDRKQLPKKHRSSGSPLRRLERYLETRGIRF